MYLTKHHGLGNDFLVTFVGEQPTDAPEIARTLCARHTGIGADGLIFGMDDGARPKMRLFNADGSSAEISGNGLRCFLQALSMQRNVVRLDVDVDTLAGARACTLEPTDDPAVAYASTDMGAVGPGDAPDSDDFLDSIPELAAVKRWALGDVGNPHLVLEVPSVESIDLEGIGATIADRFPNGVNTHLISVSDSATDTVDMRPWERGVGLTRACGSGATVVAQRVHEWDLVGPQVTVRMPGGEAVVDVATGDRTTAVLSGPTTFIGSVQVPRG